MNGGALSWASRRQECVALATTEAEYLALCDIAREVTWVRSLLRFMCEELSKPTIVLQDNMSTIALAENGRTSKRSKDIEIRYHYTREKIVDGTIKLRYCRRLRALSTEDVRCGNRRHWQFGRECQIRRCRGCGLQGCSRCDLPVTGSDGNRPAIAYMDATGPGALDRSDVLD